MITLDELRDDAAQLEALLLARTWVYTLFHKLFGGEPDGRLLEVLLGETTHDVFDEYAQDSETMAGLLGFLESLAAQDADELLEQAKSEYTRIFVGPMALPASPYESPYRGTHDESLFQENTIAVRSCYHTQGMRLKREQAVPDDHISALCAFMADLGRRSLAALVGNDAAELARTLRFQEAFCNRHMLGWLDVYASAVRNSKAGAQAVLYPQMLEAVAAFVELDATFLTEASFWAEGEPGVIEAYELCEQLQKAREGLAVLESMELFGLRDYELVELD